MRINLSVRNRADWICPYCHRPYPVRMFYGNHPRVQIIFFPELVLPTSFAAMFPELSFYP
ncbi:hypothetical protein P22_1113 [Propionispora sp. 2/2-37]|uniref:hypothetical protein n=1 Tax=Propionispora sp. 2/2-37 TaxID=1677858 RepID=UPI0006BB579D|nr:hypothetical protein [Propionispora sp. 2/2-37]CUH95044.1 hypothetical protein P22_1113 [Propionispora sp. 2/2-37]